MSRPNFKVDVRVCRKCGNQKPLDEEHFRLRRDLAKPRFVTVCWKCEREEKASHGRQLRLLKKNPKWGDLLRAGGKEAPQAPSFRDVVGNIDKVFGGAEQVARELKSQLDLARERNPGGQTAIRGYIEIFKFYKWAAEMESESIDAHNLSDEDLNRLISEMLLSDMSAEDFAEIARKRGLTVFATEEAIEADGGD